MTVIKSKRQSGKFEILSKVREMCTYTITICKNEKNFPKRDRWILTQPIVSEALAVMTCIRRANAVKVVECDDYTYRRRQQIEALSHLEALLSLIDLAYVELSIESTRVEYWTGLVLYVEDKLKGWRKSERERYKSIWQARTVTIPDDFSPRSGD